MPSLKELIQRGLEDNDEFFKIGMQIVPGYPRRVNALDYCGIPFALEKALAQSHEPQTRTIKTEETECAKQNDKSSVPATDEPDEETSELSIGTFWSFSENVSISNGDLPFEGMSGKTDLCVLPTTTQLPIQHKETSEEALVDTTSTCQAKCPMNTENSLYPPNVIQGISDECVVSPKGTEPKPGKNERKPTDVQQEKVEPSTDANRVMNSFLQLLERLSPISDVLSPDTFKNEDEKEFIEEVATKNVNGENIPILIDRESSDSSDKEMRIHTFKPIITTSDVDNDKSSISPDQNENYIPEIQIKDAICSNSTQIVTSENGKVKSINKDFLSKENQKHDCSLHVLKATIEENKSPIESAQFEHPGITIRNKPDYTSIKNVASFFKASNAMKQRKPDIREVNSKDKDPLCTSVSYAKSCDMSTVLDVNRSKRGLDGPTSSTVKNDATRIHASKSGTHHGFSHSKKKPLFKSRRKSDTELQKTTDSKGNIMSYHKKNTEKENRLLSTQEESDKNRARDERLKEGLLNLNHKHQIPPSKERASASKLLTNTERSVDDEHRTLNKIETKKRKRKEYELSLNSKRVIHSDEIVNNFAVNETDPCKDPTHLNNSCHIETSAERLCDLQSKKTRLKPDLRTLSPNDCHEERKHKNIKNQKCLISKMSTSYDVSSKENRSCFKPYTHSSYDVTVKGKEPKHRNVVHANHLTGMENNGKQNIKPVCSSDVKNVSHADETGLKKDMHSSSKVNDASKNPIVAHQLTGHVSKDKGFKISRSLSKQERHKELTGIVHYTDASQIHQQTKEDKMNGEFNDIIETSSKNRKGAVSKRVVDRHKKHCHARSKSKSKVMKDHVCIKKQCSRRHQPKVLSGQVIESIDEHGIKNRDNLKQFDNNPGDVSCKGNGINYNPTYSPLYKCLICDDLYFTSIERLEFHQKMSHNKSAKTSQPSNHKVTTKKVKNTKPQQKREMVVEDFLSKLGIAETIRNTLSVLLEKSSKKHIQDDSLKHKETFNKKATKESSNTHKTQLTGVNTVQSHIQVDLQTGSRKEDVTNKDLTVIDTEKNRALNVISMPQEIDRYPLALNKQTFDCHNKPPLKHHESKPEENINENTQLSNMSVTNQDTNSFDKHYESELSLRTNEIVRVTYPLPNAELVPEKKKNDNDEIQTISSIEPQKSVLSALSIGSKLTCTKRIFDDKPKHHNNDLSQSLIDISSKQSSPKQARKAHDGCSQVFDFRTKLLKMNSQKGIGSVELKELGLPLSKHLISSGDDTNSMRVRTGSISSVDSLTSDLEILEDPIEIDVKETVSSVNQEACSKKAGGISNTPTAGNDSRITIREQDQDSWNRDLDKYSRHHYAIDTIKDSNMLNERVYDMTSKRQFTDWSNWSHTSYGDSPFVNEYFETRHGFLGTQNRWPRSGGPISPLRQRRNVSDEPGHTGYRKTNYVPHGNWYSRVDKKSSERRPTFTSDRRQMRSSRQQRSLTPDSRRSSTSDGHRRFTSGRRHSLTSDRRRSLTPDRRRSLTPDRRRSPTPDRRRWHSPVRRRQYSHVRRQCRIYGTLQCRTTLGRRRRSRTPDRPKSGSPDRKRSRVSNRRRSPTPKVRRIRSDTTKTRRSSRPTRSRSPDSNRDRPSAIVDHQRNKSRIKESDPKQSTSADPKQSPAPECDDCPQKCTPSQECRKNEGPSDSPASVNKEDCEKSVISRTTSQKTSPTKIFSFSKHNKSLIFKSMYKRRVSLPKNTYSSQKCSNPSINSNAEATTHSEKQTHSSSTGAVNVNKTPGESILTIASNADRSENQTDVFNGETVSKITEQHRASLDDSSNTTKKARDICETESKNDTLDVVDKITSQIIEGNISIQHLHTETITEPCNNNQNVMDVDEDQSAPAILFVVCQKCGMEFQSCHDLHKHLYAHFGVLKCIKCELGFNSIEEHRNHESQSHHDRQNKSFEIESKDAMKLNKFNWKANNTIYKKNNEVCNENEKGFKNKPDVYKDENKNLRGKSLLKLNSIKKKAQRKLAKQFFQTFCNICQTSFEARIDLVDHLWKQHQKRVFSNMPSRKTSQHKTLQRQTLYIEAFNDNDNNSNENHDASQEKVIPKGRPDVEEVNEKDAAAKDLTCKAPPVREVARKDPVVEQEIKKDAAVKDVTKMESVIKEVNEKDSTVQDVTKNNATVEGVTTTDAAGKDMNRMKPVIIEMNEKNSNVQDVTKKDAAVKKLIENNSTVQGVPQNDLTDKEATEKDSTDKEATEKDSTDKEGTEKDSTVKDVNKKSLTVKEMTKKGPVVKRETKKDAAVKKVNKKNATDKKDPSVKEVTNKDAPFKEVTKKDPQRFCFICSISFDTRITLVDHLWNSHRKRVLVNPRNRDHDFGTPSRRVDHRVPRSTDSSLWERNRYAPLPRSRSRSPIRSNQRFERYSGPQSRTQDYPSHFSPPRSPPRRRQGRVLRFERSMSPPYRQTDSLPFTMSRSPPPRYGGTHYQEAPAEGQGGPAIGFHSRLTCRKCLFRAETRDDLFAHLKMEHNIGGGFVLNEAPSLKGLQHL